MVIMWQCLALLQAVIADIIQEREKERKRQTDGGQTDRQTQAGRQAPVTISDDLCHLKWIVNC